MLFKRVKLFLTLLLLSAVLLFSCTKSNQSAFELLKNLNGTWKSTGNIIVYDSWVTLNDSTLSGKRFSKIGGDTVFINNFEIKIRKNIITLIIKETKYSVKKAGLREIYFENGNNIYPEKIIMSYPGDSIYKYRQENSRGNKVIEFKMKKEG